MVISDVTSIELQRTGETAKLVMTELKQALAATVTLPELEIIALYLASEVGKWRDSLIEIEETTRT